MKTWGRGRFCAAYRLQTAPPPAQAPRGDFRFNLTVLRQNLCWTLLPPSPHKGRGRPWLSRRTESLQDNYLTASPAYHFFRREQYAHERTGKWIAKSRQLGYEQKKQEGSTVME